MKKGALWAPSIDRSRAGYPRLNRPFFALAGFFLLRFFAMMPLSVLLLDMHIKPTVRRLGRLSRMFRRDYGARQVGTDRGIDAGRRRDGRDQLQQEFRAHFSSPLRA